MVKVELRVMWLKRTLGEPLMLIRIERSRHAALSRALPKCGSNGDAVHRRRESCNSLNATGSTIHQAHLLLAHPYAVTMRFTTSVLLAAATLLGAATAHNIQLAAHGRECFHEFLHKDDKMTVTFQVGDREFGSAGNLDIDFWVRRQWSKLQCANTNSSRSRTRTEDVRPIKRPYRMETTPLRRSMTGSTSTASATSTGSRPPRTSHSMCMA